MKCKECGAEIVVQKGKTIKIPELGIELMPKQQQNNTLFKNIKIPKGFRLIKATEILKYWNNDIFRDAVLKANNNDVWFFVDNLDCYKNKYIAGFLAYSFGSYFLCYWSVGVSYSSLGVIFVRDLK